MRGLTVVSRPRPHRRRWPPRPRRRVRWTSRVVPARIPPQLDRCRPGHSEDPLIFHRKQKLQVLAPIGRVALHRGIGNHCLRSILGGVAPGPYPSAALMAVHGWKMSAPKARQTRTTPRERKTCSRPRTSRISRLAPVPFKAHSPQHCSPHLGIKCGDARHRRTLE